MENLFGFVSSSHEDESAKSFCFYCEGARGSFKAQIKAAQRKRIILLIKKKVFLFRELQTDLQFMG